MDNLQFTVNTLDTVGMLLMFFRFFFLNIVHLLNILSTDRVGVLPGLHGHPRGVEQRLLLSGRGRRRGRGWGGGHRLLLRLRPPPLLLHPARGPEPGPGDRHQRSHGDRGDGGGLHTAAARDHHLLHLLPAVPQL